MINEQNGLANAETENEQWNKFQHDSGERITDNEKRIDIYKHQSNRIRRNMKLTFDKTVFNLEKKNNALRKMMKEFTDDITKRQEKFKEDFNKSMEELL